MEADKKRPSTEVGRAADSARKKLKVDLKVNESKQLQKIQETIDTLEQECAKEQLEVQRKFDAKKAVHFKERDEAMAKLNLWPRALANNQAVADMIQDEDVELLQNYLYSVELQDHIDDSGTFEIKFIFKDSASKVFTPTTLVKRMAFDKNCHPDLSNCLVTEVKFVDDAKNPIKLIEKRKSEMQGAGRMKETDESDDVSSEGDLDICSIFEWFNTKGDEVWPGFADYFRSVIYQNPLESALGPDVSDIDDTSDDDSDEGEE